jgi:AbrB family looped-hinge helix DNA binding protein
MGDYKAKIGPNGRIVIPAACRKALGLELGDEVLMRLEDGGLKLFTPEQLFRRAQARVAKHARKTGKSVVDELIEERRRWAEEG